MKKKKRRTQSNTSLSDSRNRERSASETAETQADSPNLGGEQARPDTETPTPCIILENAKMEAATEVLRESSPRTSTTSRPKLMRQSSVEMQQAVDVPRPLNTERKKSTSLSIPVDTHTRGGSTEEIELEIELSSKQIDLYCTI